MAKEIDNKKMWESIRKRMGDSVYARDIDLALKDQGLKYDSKAGEIVSIEPEVDVAYLTGKMKGVPATEEEIRGNTHPESSAEDELSEWCRREAEKAARETTPAVEKAIRKWCKNFIKLTEPKWYVALEDYGYYDNNVFGRVPLFLKGERTTKEKVFKMCADIMGYTMTEEEFNKHFILATEENVANVRYKQKGGIKAGNWYVCDCEIINESGTAAFHRDSVYYCPKDGWLDVDGMLIEVGTLNESFRLATKEEIPQEPKPNAIADGKPAIVDKNGLHILKSKQDTSELSEFEKCFQGMCHDKNQQFIKECCASLMELARKQLQPDFDKELELAYKNQDEVVYSRGYQEGYEAGFQAEVSKEDIQKASALYADEDQSIFFNGVAYGQKLGHQEAEAEIREKVAGEINVDDVDGFCYDEIKERHLHGRYFEAKSFGLECYRKGIQDTLDLIKKE